MSVLSNLPENLDIAQLVVLMTQVEQLKLTAEKKAEEKWIAARKVEEARLAADQETRKVAEVEVAREAEEV